MKHPKLDLQSALPFGQGAASPPAPAATQDVKVLFVAISVAIWQPNPVTLQLVALAGLQFCEHIVTFGTVPPTPSFSLRRQSPPGPVQSASFVQNSKHDPTV